MNLLEQESQMSTKHSFCPRAKRFYHRAKFEFLFIISDQPPKGPNGCGAV